MAKCSRCGKSVGLFASMCADCKAAVKAEEAEQQERLEAEKRGAAERARQEHESLRRAIVQSKAQSAQQRIEQGEKLYLYESVYLSVDSKILDSSITDKFDIAGLRQMGFDGWDIIAIIPRTAGVALTNRSYGASSGETWGAGLGGNVVGIHAILKKELSAQNKAQLDILPEYISRNLSDFLSDEEAASLLKLLKQSAA
jgi:hypothetical protein